MSIQRGLVRSIETRDDGWVEVILISVHAGNVPHTLFIEDLDGDLTQVHRRLAKLALLRDALARTLPVEVAFEETDHQGDLIQDVTILRTRSIEGRRGNWWVKGHVIGLSVLERGPEQDLSPYTDEADRAITAILLDDGTIVSYIVDLQRPHVGTGHAILEMLAESRRSRRVLRLQIAPVVVKDETMDDGGFIVGADWPALEPKELDEEVAFIERLGQHSESLSPTTPALVERVWVKYTTAPDQNPEGDISENGSFLPERKEVWVHQDSPLLGRLLAALRDSLQVKIGLLDNEIHAVELVSHLGSAARPIWITFGGEPLCEEVDEICRNEPTIHPPTKEVLDVIPQSVLWRGSAFFNEGIWRFVVYSPSRVELLIDGKEPCGERIQTEALTADTYPTVQTNAHMSIDRPTTAFRGREDRQMDALMVHVYLNGLHTVEFKIHGRTCNTQFRVLIYRIR